MAVETFQRTGRTRIMAAINVSPESFYSGSVGANLEQLAARVREAEAAGAEMIDIGAKSTAPYKETQIPEEEEVRRMRDAIRAARRATKLPISADTQSAAVARAALEEGANIINDVSALLADPQMASVCRDAEGVILMANGEYVEDWKGAEADPASFVAQLLHGGVERAIAAGVDHSRIIVDPGVGFFRKAPVHWADWDLALLRADWQAHMLDASVLIGASRKSFLGHLLGGKPPEERLAASLAVAAWCAMRGADWLRVHDVSETVDIIGIISLLKG